MDRCTTCDEWVYASSTRAHRCAPVWRVRDEESNGDYLDSEVHASDAEIAAEKAVDRYWSDDPDGDPPQGFVCIVEPVGPPHHEERVRTRVMVGGEYAIEWHSETLKSEAAPMPCPKCKRPVPDHSSEGREGRRYLCERCYQRWDG